MAQYKDKDTLLKLGEMDPEVAELIKANGPVTLDLGDIYAFRGALEAARPQLASVLAEVPATIKASSISYPTRDGGSVGVRLVQPATSSTSGPLVIIIHGGGFSGGFAELGEPQARALAQTYGAVCLAVTHRVAPEHPFPGPVEDIWDCIVWAAKNAASWGADPKLGFVIGGTSSGANLAAIATIMSRHENFSPAITGTSLNIPHLIPIENPPEHLRPWYLAWEQNKDAPMLPRGACLTVLGSYKPKEDDWRYTPYAYPGGLKNLDLPKTVFQIAGLDPLRDDGLLYERTLREELGVDTKLYVYPGVPHGHGMFPTLKAAQQEQVDFVESMGWLLDRKSTQ